MNKDLFARLQQRAGIYFMGNSAPIDLQIADAGASVRVAADGSLACDAQPALVTTSNAGIPAYLSTYVDPQLIEVLVAPMNAELVMGDAVKKGSWITPTAVFPVVESTGVTASYGDFNTNGRSGVNANFPQRQSYHYQTMSEWGERELEQAGEAKIDLANRVGIASVLTLNKFQNASYFFGVAGLQNYGLLNDPSLSSALTPATKAAGGVLWTNATAIEIYDDVRALFVKLQTQSKGVITTDSPLRLAMSPTAQVNLLKVTTFNVSVSDMLKKNFPKLEVVVAPEYSTGSGELVQMLVPELQGQRTAAPAFTEKLRAHPIIAGNSGWSQKKSQGTWGTVIFRPFLIAQMLGV